MVADKQVVVKLAEEQQAVVDWGGVKLEDARWYTPKMITIIDLDDAIALAKAVLRFVGEESVVDRTEDEEYFAWLVKREAERFDAVAFMRDCALEHGVVGYGDELP